MHDGIDTLVLAAHALELEGLELPAAAAPPVLQRAVGVGLVAASVGTAQSLAQLRPRRVILLGSYGRYPTANAPSSTPELLVPDSIRWLDAGVVAGEAAFPELVATAVEPDDELSSSLAQHCGALRAALGVTAAITTDDGLAFRLAAAGCHGENLEALGVALACGREGVPFAALLGCTNEVGSRGRAQWRQRHREVALATHAALVAWLSR